VYGWEAGGAARAANMVLPPTSALLHPQPCTPRGGSRTVCFPGGLACPWSASAAACVEPGTGRKAKTQLPKRGQFILPPRRTSEYLGMIFRSHLTFLHVRKILREEHFQCGVASPGRRRHATAILQLRAMRAAGHRAGRAWRNPASPSARWPGGFPSHRLHLQQQR